MPNYQLSGFQTPKGIIGKGLFSRIIVAYHVLDSEWRVWKRIKKEEIHEHARSELVATRLEREVFLLERLSHEFLIKLLGKFKDKDYYYLVFDYYKHGDLRSLLQRRGPLPEELAQFYTAQILSVLHYLHTISILYRGLRPEKVCIDNQGFIRIIDLGLAKKVPPQRFTYTLVGDPEYVAPEILLRKGYSLPIDVWALGILVYELLCGAPPFCGLNPISVYRRILHNNVSDQQYHDKPLVASFIEKLLQKDPQSRPNTNAAKNLAWLSSTDWDALAKKSSSVEVPHLSFLEREKDDDLAQTSNTGPHPDDILERYCPPPLTVHQGYNSKKAASSDQKQMMIHETLENLFDDFA